MVNVADCTRGSVIRLEVSSGFPIALHPARFPGQLAADAHLFQDEDLAAHEGPQISGSNARIC